MQVEFRAHPDCMFNYVVSRYVDAAGTVRYTVYQPAKVTDTHATITHEEGYGWLGEIMSQLLPDKINALPVGPERWATIAARRKMLADHRQAAIEDTYPEDFMVR